MATIEVKHVDMLTQQTIAADVLWQELFVRLVVTFGIKKMLFGCFNLCAFEEMSTTSPLVPTTNLLVLDEVSIQATKALIQKWISETIAKDNKYGDQNWGVNLFLSTDSCNEVINFTHQHGFKWKVVIASTSTVTSHEKTK